MPRLLYSSSKLVILLLQNRLRKLILSLHLKSSQVKSSQVLLPTTASRKLILHLKSSRVKASMRTRSLALLSPHCHATRVPHA